jgi:glycosyltransferase involved in cell wall biosynthesis
MINTCGEKLRSLADIAYVNGIPPGCAHFLQEKSGKRKGYSVVYYLLSKMLRKFDPSLVITNSTFNKELMERCTEKTAMVVYPPVSAKKYGNLANKRRRKNLVLTYSQYVPTQNLLYVPKIAKLVEEAKFSIIGPGGPAMAETVEELQRLIANLSIGGRVSLLIDRPFSEFADSLSIAKVFLRTLHHEPFGMSVVEAMAAGCIPVVPRDGGPWIDILHQEQGRYGYSYRSIREAADIIKLLLGNEKLREKVSERAQRRALDFEGFLFKEKVQAIINKVYASKRER